MYQVYGIANKQRKLLLETDSQDSCAEFIEDKARQDVENMFGMTSEDEGFFDEVDELKDMYEIVKATK